MARVKIGNVFPTLEWLMQHCAPSGYGLGNKSGKSVLWSQINNAKEFGLYAIWGDEGQKTIGGYTFYYAKLLVIPLDDNAVTQMLFPIGTNGIVLIRNCEGGVWNDWEWLCPPMSPGVEYRTTETWYGAPVYTVLFETGTLNNAKDVVATGFSARRIIRTSGYIDTISLPYIDGTLDGANSALVSAAVYNGKINLTFNVGSAQRGKGAVVQLWYTKE